MADHVFRLWLLPNTYLGGLAGMTIILRVLLLALLVVVALYIFRRIARRLAVDPRMRHWFSGPGFRMLRMFLLRMGLPLLLRAFRMMRFFR